MDCVRESFVFHSEYISDLPEEYIEKFTMYAVSYGICGLEPEVSGLEHALWAKIKRRIDADTQAWEEKKQARSEAGRRGGRKKKDSADYETCDLVESSNLGEEEKINLEFPEECHFCKEKKLQPINFGNGEMGIRCSSCGSYGLWSPLSRIWDWHSGKP